MVWPTDSISRLQSSPNLESGSWQDVPLPANYLQTCGYSQTPISAGASNCFYRAVVSTDY